MVITWAVLLVTKKVRPVADASVTTQVYVLVLVKVTGRLTCAVVLAPKLTLPISMKALAINGLLRLSVAAVVTFPVSAVPVPAFTTCISMKFPAETGAVKNDGEQVVCPAPIVQLPTLVSACVPLPWIVEVNREMV